MMDVDLGFEAFLWLFNTTLDKHAPIKKTYKKEEKDKTMGYQRNKKIYVSQRQNLQLQTNDKRKRSADKNRKTQKH